MKFILLFIVVLTGVSSCTHVPNVSRQATMAPLRPAQLTPFINDDLQLGPLIEGIQNQIEFLKSRRPSYLRFHFGERSFTTEEYLSALQFLVSVYRENQDKDFFIQKVVENFDFFETLGHGQYGDLLITSYFGPVLSGSTRRTTKYSVALYKVPDDLVEIKLKDFPPEHYSLGVDRPSDRSVLYGRILEKKSLQGRIQIGPYFSRGEIDVKGALLGKNLELCYVDPIDAFILHIQGSGQIVLENGQILNVGYAGQNGRKYVSLGKVLSGHIPPHEMGLKSIEKYLRSLPHQDMMKLLNSNPSYVFFRPLGGRPITSLGTEVIDGRTIATDVRYYPKGALGLLVFQRPRENDLGEPHPDHHGVEKVGRFILDQDTGGAIKGTGRVDLFWGTGDIAKQFAGRIKTPGKLYYLAPKDTLMKSLNSSVDLSGY